MPKKTKEEILTELKKRYTPEEETEAMMGKSAEYQLFEQEKLTQGAWFEKACNFIKGVGLSVTLAETDKKKLQDQIDVLGINVRPEDVYGLGMMSLLVFA